MAKVSVGTLQQATLCSPPGITGRCETKSYFNGDTDPIHLYLHRIARGDVMRVDATAIDRLSYVWQGEVEAGGRQLAQGSSLIVEHGATLELVGQADESMLVTFSASRPQANQRAGGHVHLLPTDRVPRVGEREGSSTSGGLHSDGNCPTCELWLNENSLPGQAAPAADADALKGVHSHPEDEVIFVTEGQIRLGRKLYDAGTALAIAAHTLYGFSPGPQGLSFITFRTAKSTAIRFASGGDYIASTFWDKVGSIGYLEPLHA